MAYSWNTGTAVFFRLLDGKIAVQRRNGVWRLYRPVRHIVVPRNPKVRTLLRAQKRIAKLTQALPKRTVRARDGKVSRDDLKDLIIASRGRN